MASRFYKKSSLRDPWQIISGISRQRINITSDLQCSSTLTLSPIIGSNIALRYTRNVRLLPFVIPLQYRGFESLPVSYPSHLNHLLPKMPVRPFVLSDLDSSNKESLDPAKKFHRSIRGWFGPMVAVKFSRYIRAKGSKLEGKSIPRACSLVSLCRKRLPDRSAAELLRVHIEALGLVWQRLGYEVGRLAARWRHKSVDVWEPSGPVAARIACSVIEGMALGHGVERAILLSARFIRLRNVPSNFSCSSGPSVL